MLPVFVLSTCTAGWMSAANTKIDSDCVLSSFSGRSHYAKYIVTHETSSKLQQLASKKCEFFFLKTKTLAALHASYVNAVLCNAETFTQ